VFGSDEGEVESSTKYKNESESLDEKISVVYTKAHNTLGTGLVGIYLRSFHDFR